MKTSYSLYDCTVDYSVEAAADIYRNEDDMRMYSENYSCKKPQVDCKPPSNPVCDENTTVIGNSVNFSVCPSDSEIKADVIVGYRNSIRIWGQVRDCNGQPVSCAYVKLVKITPKGLVGIAHTITDCLGFYQFDICICTDGCDFTVIVGKAATGPERSVTSGFRGLNCNIINPGDDSCNPCMNHCK